MSEEDIYYGGEEDGLDFGDEDDIYGGAGGSGGSSSDDDGSFGGFGSEEADGGEGGESVGGEAGEDLEFGDTFKDLQRTAGGALKAGAGTGIGSKSLRSAEEAAIEKARGILNGEVMYEDVRDHEKDKIIEMITRMDGKAVERASIEVLVPALLFKVRRLKLEKDFASYAKKIKNVEPADLLRYIRAY